MQSYTTNVEAVTGEKRQRDRDEEHPAMPHPNSRANVTSGIDQNSQQNGNFSTVGSMPPASAQAMPGYDALYIGDLQWVRLRVGCTFKLFLPCIYYIKPYS